MFINPRIEISRVKRQKVRFIDFCASLILPVLLLISIPNSSIAQTAGKKPLTRGELVFQAETLLAERGYWITKVDTVWDASTYHAVTAFQKVEGRKRTGKLIEADLEAIRNSVRPLSVFIGDAHVEVDLQKQVLYLVDRNDVVTHILPVSTGNGKAYYESGKRQIAVTPTGTFNITRQIKGTRHAPLGPLYHPSYFYGGVAIHGGDSIPFYAASHGCVRIPRFSSTAFSDLVWVGMRVIVYESAEKARQGS